MQIINQRNRMLEHILSLNELLKDNDDEMKKLAEDEKKTYEAKMATVEQELLESLIPADDQDFCDSVVLEVNAGVGGQEAMLFAHELFDMYMSFAEYKGWTNEVAEFDTTDLGGLRHASVFVSGSDVFRYFKYEAGVHRVQRIPTTERAGRVHTSTVSVVCLPQPKDVDVTIHEKDLRIETKRASGAGGQHVNTTDSAVRIVHLPTGVAVECQVDRSQIKNREIAMQRLRAMLYEQQINAQMEENEATRKSQVKSNFRNEKIRTYNFSQDRITDHRLQSSNMHNMKGFLLGGEQLEILINKLHSAAKYENLMRVLNSVKTS
ncbi:mitochondrial translation release factor 1 [Carabus blaptoides fortunei]